MEEILASIRKIISEDSNEAPPAPAPAAAAPAAAAPAPQPAAPAPAAPVAQAPAAAPTEAQPDVLELTQEFIAAEPVQAEPEPPPAPKPDNDVVFESEAPKSEVPMSASSDDIFSDTTRQAIDNAFSNIPDEAPAPARPRMEPLPAPDGASIESVFERAVRESFEPVLAKYLSENSGAVIDRMKPLIREWMDENFPALLDQAVRAEVERVVKARRR
jgi:cell pole-organizing protein PopZ